MADWAWERTCHRQLSQILLGPRIVSSASSSCSFLPAYTYQGTLRLLCSSCSLYFGHFTTESLPERNAHCNLFFANMLLTSAFPTAILRFLGTGLYAYAIAFLGARYTGHAEVLSSPYLTQLVASAPFWLKLSLKAPIAAAFNYHNFNGIRHLAWDWGYCEYLMGVCKTCNQFFCELKVQLTKSHPSRLSLRRPFQVSPSRAATSLVTLSLVRPLWPLLACACSKHMAAATTQ